MKLVYLSWWLRQGQMGFKSHQQINFREKEKQLLDKILGHYDKRIRPAGGNGTGKSKISIISLKIA